MLFLAGGTAAAGATAYVAGALDPYLADKPAVVAALPRQCFSVGPFADELAAGAAARRIGVQATQLRPRAAAGESVMPARLKAASASS